MGMLRWIAPLAALLLGGCFTSDQPLFAASEGKLPIAAGKYRLGDSRGVITLRKVDGNHYEARRTGDSSPSALTLVPLREDLYVAQNVHAHNPTPMYAVVRVRDGEVALLQPDCKTQAHRDVAAAFGALVTPRDPHGCHFATKSKVGLALYNLAAKSSAEQWQPLVPARR